ncbi:MAG TPA: hypothetical protein VM510_04210 [Caulifigura sp.]|nr:hypothetical protein [Caulifigura sp.]
MSSIECLDLNPEARPDRSDAALRRVVSGTSYQDEALNKHGNETGDYRRQQL